MHGQRTVGAGCPRATKSATQPASGAQKNSDVPSGAATAEMSASPGPRRAVEHRRAAARSARRD